MARIPEAGLHTQVEVRIQAEHRGEAAQIRQEVPRTRAELGIQAVRRGEAPWPPSSSVEQSVSTFFFQFFDSSNPLRASTNRQQSLT